MKARPHLFAINIGFFKTPLAGTSKGWCLYCAAGLEACRGGWDTFVHIEGGRDVPIIYPKPSVTLKKPFTDRGG